MKLWHYIQGNRKGKEAHQIEIEAMKDTFLADALEGYEKTYGKHQRVVSRLQKEITRRQRRITNKSLNKSPNHLKTWSIAASVLIVAGIGTWFLLVDKKETSREITPPKEITVTIKKETEPVKQDQPGIQTEQPKEEKPAQKPVEAPVQKPVEVQKAEAPTVAQEAEKPVVAQATTTDIPENNTSLSPQPEPVTGMQAYMGYIQRNMKRPTDEECRDVKGAVVVMFKIGQSGRPYNIRATQGLCPSINKEAIRLIIHGPDWKKGQISDEATITINF